MKGSRTRVVITGMGAVSPHGIGVDLLWERLAAGQGAIQPTERTAGKHRVTKPAAVLRDYRAELYLNPDKLVFMDPFAQFALIAANEAIASAKLSIEALDPTRIGVVLGTSSGGDTAREIEADRFFHQGKRRCNPALVSRTNHQSAVGAISMEHGITGPCFVVNSGCAAGTHAIAQAVLLLRSGLIDQVITGGAEACAIFSTMKAFEAMNALASDTCRPFSRDRSGLVLGEGAGVLVMETLASAQNRGAPILAELAGIGMSADAADPVQPTAHGPAMAMRMAVEDGGYALTDVDYINAHGTGTQANDRVETQAIKDLFGDHARNIAVSATKSHLGHAFGASGGLELISCVKTLQEGLIPATLNYLGPDPECELDLVHTHARQTPVNLALSNSFAIGGLNAVLAVSPFRQQLG